MSQQQTNLQLDWLFVAFFSKGDPIVQEADDRPQEQPEGSAFSDVLARIDDLTAFELHHVDGDKVVTVDMKTGAFVANGIPMHLHNQNFEPENHKLKLIYFRETRVDQVVKSTVMADGSLKEEKVGNPRHYVNRYFIGWETIVNGKNKQVTLAVG